MADKPWCFTKCDCGENKAEHCTPQITCDSCVNKPAKCPWHYDNAVIGEPIPAPPGSAPLDEVVEAAGCRHHWLGAIRCPECGEMHKGKDVMAQLRQAQRCGSCKWWCLDMQIDSRKCNNYESPFYGVRTVHRYEACQKWERINAGTTEHGDTALQRLKGE